jgi:hypothetical protein
MVRKSKDDGDTMSLLDGVRHGQWRLGAVLVNTVAKVWQGGAQ